MLLLFGYLLFGHLKLLNKKQKNEILATKTFETVEQEAKKMKVLLQKHL